MAKISAKVWAAVALFAAAVRVYRLDRFSYWLDEILQSAVAHGSWPFLWAKLAEDANHPPLDSIVTKLLSGAGASNLALKIPAVVWGMAGVVALGKLVERRSGRAAAILSAFLLALAPFHVRYSQELRPYALGMFLLLVSLLALDRWLEKRTRGRLAALYVGFLATAYALYLAALVLGVAAASMLLDDAASAEPARRESARRALRWSPAFLALLAAGYLPWIPIVRAAAGHAPYTAAPPMSLSRLGSVLAFFCFAPGEGRGLAAADVVSLVLAAAGLALCLRRPGERFLAGWVVAGSAAVEILEHVHPNFFGPRHFLPAALGVPVLVSLAVVSIGRWNLLRSGATAALVVFLAAADARGLAAYFRSGRPDWRPLASYLRARHGRERIVTDSQWTQLCVAYYVFGPTWLCCGDGRAIVFVNGRVDAVPGLREPGKSLWLVASEGPGGTPEFTRFVEGHAVAGFPEADVAFVGRLPP